jgi:GNAT superfamily N-acetyltransferase
MVSIEPVSISNTKQLKAFIDFPHDLYKSDPNYVPELFIAQRDILTPGKHPFHEHSYMQLFLAVENGEVKGRIAAILNNNHNSFNNAKDGFFGFFDSVDNQSTADSLFAEATKWLASQKVENVIGPVNPSTNEPCGLLVDGFDRPPVAMMPYNRPYYSRLIENAGYQKLTDLYAYHISAAEVNDKSIKLQDALLERLNKKGITIRTINLKHFKNEVKGVREIYNAAWDRNLGFVPMTENEFNYLAKDLKLILNKDFCLIAEHNDKMVGFALAIPDINQVLIKVKRGRLFPAGIFKLLLGLKKIDFYRVITLGVMQEYRKMGIEACFYSHFIKKVRQMKVTGGEGSWILENNEMMNKGLQNMNGHIYKTYRLYQKPL